MSVSPVCILSAPLGVGRDAASVQFAAKAQFAQILLGSEARIRIAANILAAAGLRPLITTVPENFSTPQSFQIIHAMTESRLFSPDTLVHIRFGLAERARIFKHARNLFLSPGRQRRSTPFGEHMLADGKTLPHAFKVVLHHREPPALRRKGSGALEFRSLPPIFVCDSPPALGVRGAGAGPLSPMEFANTTGIQVEAFAEFNARRWDSSADSFPQSLPRGLSHLFARALADGGRIRQQGEQGPDGARDRSSGGAFVLVPFDLSDPLSIAPDILRTFLAYPGLRRDGVKLVLLPFEVHGRVDRLERLVTEIRSRAQQKNDRAPRDELFVAQVTRDEDAAVLSRLFPVAIVDAASPDGLWTIDRLGHFGVAVAAADIRISGQVRSLPPNVIYQQALDEIRRERIVGELGERLVEGPGLSRRGIAQLITTAAQHARQPLRMPAAAPVRPLNRADINVLLFGRARPGAHA